MQTKIITENSWRLEKFQTKTILGTENGHQVIWKCPITEVALPFINDIAEREKASREYLKGHFDVLCGTLEDGCLKYDYLPYKSLLQVIETQFQQNCPLAADETVKTYVDKIKDLQSIYTIPKDFYQTIGLGNSHDNTKLLCLSRGLIDLTPRNILVNDEHWIAIDFEWAFDFPVPIIFILFRAIHEMATGLQKEIRQSATVSNPVVGVFARGLHTHYVPKSWLSHITDTNVSLNRLLQWEMGFQRYIAGSFCDTVGRIKRHPKTRVHFLSKAVESDTGMLENATGALKRIPGMRKLVHLLERKAACWRK
jgi:hypothetical protein